MNRKSANLKIIKHLRKFLNDNPDLRLGQALVALGVVVEHIEEWRQPTWLNGFNEEPEAVLARVEWRLSRLRNSGRCGIPFLMKDVEKVAEDVHGIPPEEFIAGVEIARNRITGSNSPEVTEALEKVFKELHDMPSEEFRTLVDAQVLSNTPFPPNCLECSSKTVNIPSGVVCGSPSCDWVKPNKSSIPPTDPPKPLTANANLSSELLLAMKCSIDGHDYREVPARHGDTYHSCSKCGNQYDMSFWDKLLGRKPK